LKIQSKHALVTSFHVSFIVFEKHQNLEFW
jgi:hypothetical protein